MKLLFDENLSRRLVPALALEYPGSSHVELEGLRAQTDEAIWQHAREAEFVIVSKDNDFRQLSFLRGGPPKVVWLSVGNATTAVIGALLREAVGAMAAFEAEPEASLLVLDLLAE